MQIIADFFQFIYASAAANTACIYVSSALLPLAQKVHDFVTHYSPMMTGTFRGVSGFQNLNTGLIERYIRVYEQVYTPRKLARKIQNAQAHMYRGALLYGSSFFTIAAGIYRAQHTELHAGYFIAKNLGSLFFIFANSVSLQQNVQQYNEAQELIHHSLSATDKKRGEILYRSAMLGILNSMGNIFGASLTLMDFYTTFIFVIGFLSSLTGATKAIHDYRSKEQMATPLRPQKPLINPAVKKRLVFD